MIIQNNRLTVTLQQPGREYRRSRFDWGAIISGIVLDNKVNFCSQEATGDNLGTEGTGLTFEFGINKAVGYDEVKPGDFFPKIGVGFLKRESHDDYDFFHDYQVKPVDVSVKQDEQVHFIQQSPVINGYGWILDRSIGINENRLVVETCLKNSGEKRIITNEYCHNFLKLGDNPVGSQYLLGLNRDVSLCESKGVIQHDKRSISPDGEPESWFYCAAEEADNSGEFCWRLEHKECGIAVICEEKFNVSRFALWGMRHVISPEFFIEIDLKPQESLTWSRCYSFEQ